MFGAQRRDRVWFSFFRCTGVGSTTLGRSGRHYRRRGRRGKSCQVGSLGLHPQSQGVVFSAAPPQGAWPQQRRILPSLKGGSCHVRWNGKCFFWRQESVRRLVGLVLSQLEVGPMHDPALGCGGHGFVLSKIGLEDEYLLQSVQVPPGTLPPGAAAKPVPDGSNRVWTAKKSGSRVIMSVPRRHARDD